MSSQAAVLKLVYNDFHFPGIAEKICLDTHKAIRGIGVKVGRIEIGSSVVQVSRTHAVFFLSQKDGTWYVTVQGRIGIYVNREKVVKGTEYFPLHQGDKLTFLLQERRKLQYKFCCDGTPEVGDEPAASSSVAAQGIAPFKGALISGPSMGPDDEEDPVPLGYFENLSENFLKVLREKDEAEEKVEKLMKENEELRGKLAETKNDYVESLRMNENGGHLDLQIPFPNEFSPAFTV